MKKQKLTQDSKEGFTLVEVMLVLAITSLMLVGVISGTYIAIARQRYNDSLRSFAEYMRTVYNEVMSPESLGQGNSNEAVLGKLVVFGHNYDGDDKYKVYSATIVSDGASKDIAKASTASGFKDELKIVNARLFCGTSDRPSTVDFYLPLWESYAAKTDPNMEQVFKGSFIIARAPTSGTIHTIFKEDADYDLRDGCTADGSQSAKTAFANDVTSGLGGYNDDQPTTFCVNFNDGVVLRAIQIAPDARNTSGISLLTDEESPCTRS